MRQLSIEKAKEYITQASELNPFPYKDIRSVFGRWDCSEEELKFIHKYLATIEYNQYDRLIQLCDALALPNGICLMEKRMIEVALRYGTNEFTVVKWKATFKIKEDIEKEIGQSIYSFFPNVRENTFNS